MPSNQHNTLLPAFSLILSATLWGLLWYPLRILEQGGLSGIWTTLVAYSACLLIGAVYIGKKWREWKIRPVLLLALAAAAGWCNVSFIIAIIDGNVVRVVLLFYLSPFWAVLLGRIILGERLSPGSKLVFVFAMTGAVIMLWDPAIGMPWPEGMPDWMALSSGFSFALTNVLIRKLQEISIPVKTVTAWVGAVVIAIVWIFLRQLELPAVESTIWIGAILLGIFGLTIMTISVQYGVTHMPIHRSAIILLFEVVVAAISAAILTDERLAVYEWIGGALVILAALLSARVQAKS
jgi:drug/metabolite transporter (DMT)-like permease